MGVGVARVELDRALVSCGCLVQPETILQDDPEIAVPVGAVGLELDASLDQRDCFVASLLLMGEDSGEVQGPSMIGRGFENAAVDLGSGRVLLGRIARLDVNFEDEMHRSSATNTARRTAFVVAS